MELTQVIKKPIITEKSMKQAAENQYLFEVNKDASKKDIARAVEAQFGVEVYRVTVQNKRGKGRRILKTGQQIVTPKQRRAIVIINPKDKIEIFEAGEKE